MLMLMLAIGVIPACFACAEAPLGEEALCAAWELYLSHNDRVNGVVTYKLITNSEPTPNRDDVYLFAFRDKFALVENHYKGKTKRSEAYGYNSHYSFTLTRPTDSERWSLTNIAPPFGDDSEHTRAARELQFVKGYVFRLLSRYEQLVQDLRDKRFKLLSIHESPDKQWLDVAFQATDFNLPKGRLTLEGTVRCANVSPYYLPREFKLKSAWPDANIGEAGTREGRHVLELIYEDRGGFPRLIEARRTRSVPGLAQHSQVEETLKFNLSNQLPPLERFYVSHYGLQEAFGIAAPTPTPWFLYFSAGGFGLLFLAFFLWRVLAKRQARGVS